MVLVDAVAQHKLAVTSFLALWWFCAVSTLTFTYSGNADSGIFSSAQNGFFATWVATFAAFFLAFEVARAQSPADPAEEAVSQATDPNAVEDGSENGGLSDPRMYLGMLLVSSFYGMWSSWNVCANSSCEDYEGLALVLGTTSLVLCVVMVALYKLAPETAKAAQPNLAMTLFLLWVIGAMFLTSKAPYQDMCGGKAYFAPDGSAVFLGSANGYCATWLCLIASALFLMEVPSVSHMVPFTPPPRTVMHC